jgi:GTPase SAR1 family protein
MIINNLEEAEFLSCELMKLPNPPVIVLCGAQGCGKTSLVRRIQKEIVHLEPYECALRGTALQKRLSDIASAVHRIILVNTEGRGVEKLANIVVPPGFVLFAEMNELSKDGIGNEENLNSNKRVVYINIAA